MFKPTQLVYLLRDMYIPRLSTEAVHSLHRAKIASELSLVVASLYIPTSCTLAEVHASVAPFLPSFHRAYYYYYILRL